MAPARAHPLVLLPALAVAAAGLASLGLALAPGAPAAPAALPPPAAAPAPPAEAAPSAALWPALFGQPPAPAAPAPTLPEPQAPAAPAPRPALTLRGVAVDAAGGWALIDGAQGMVLARRGTPLAEGHAVAEILTDAVVIDGPDGPWRLEFGAPAPPAEGRPRRSLPGTILGGLRVFTDESGMPMPLPPAGHSPGPGTTGADMR